MTIQTNAASRKELAKRISEFTGQPSHYLGIPTYAYEIGGFTILRDGTIEGSCASDERDLRSYLEHIGLVEPESDALSISVPVAGMDGNGLRNLVNMVHAEQYLLNKVTGHNDFHVPDNLIEILAGAALTDMNSFMTAMKTAKTEMTGLAFDAENATFRFTLSGNPRKNLAYAELAAFMTARAKKAKHIKPVGQKPENEKYYLRIWFVRLGMGGRGAKESRKALLEGLQGHTAFRTPADEARHKARLAEKKADKNS